MTNSVSPSVFESFNARNLSPVQVAQRFIPPQIHFSDLILRRHSLIVGPRGSGKTTLLKMLQLPALAAWSHTEAESYRAAIDFTGAFIAADVSWGAQLHAIGGTGLPSQISQILGLSAFTTHVQLAILDSMRDAATHRNDIPKSLLDKYVPFSKNDEVSFCRAISDNWRLSPSLPTFHGLKLSLRSRLSDIATIARREALVNDSGTTDRVASNDFLFLNFLETCIFAIEVFNKISKQQDRKWALLFDELEIAPREIRRALFAALRSTDQRLIFKMSISPYHEDAVVLEGNASAMAGQDYQPIELWYPRKEEGYRFSEDLLNAMIDDAGIKDASPDQLFGRSYFEAGDDDRDLNLSTYRPGTSIHKRFKSLSKKDDSFRSYLASHNIDIDKMHLLSEVERAGIIRKGTSVVAVREAYRSRGDLVGAPTRTGRSRKSPLLYTGADSLFAIIEGNPRWFIGIMAPMIRTYADSKRAVPRTAQAKTVTTATNRFRALLRTIPYRPQSGAARGLLTLLDDIGHHFHEGVVAGPFNPDPPLSFVVDSTSPPEVLEALGRALNAGAIILAGERGGDALLNSLRGKRFRLSYMLSPGYGLPLTLGRPISLSKILEKKAAYSKQLDFIEPND